MHCLHVVVVPNQLVKTLLKPRLHLDLQTHHFIVDGADYSCRRIQAASRTLVPAEKSKKITVRVGVNSIFLSFFFTFFFFFLLECEPHLLHVVPLHWSRSFVSQVTSWAEKQGHGCLLEAAQEDSEHELPPPMWTTCIIITMVIFFQVEPNPTETKLWESW